MSKNNIIPLPVLKILKILGQNIRNARLRRRITMKLLAERAGINVLTLAKVEKGNESTFIGSYASVLFSLGMIDQLKNIGDITNDLVGRMLDEERLPKRIKMNKKEKD